MTGTIPLALGFLEKLVDIRLAVNKFEGTIPTVLGVLSHLETLFLEDNRLHGMIPDEFGQLSMLSSLRFHFNDISGVVPDGVCRLVENGNPKCFGRLCRIRRTRSMQLLYTLLLNNHQSCVLYYIQSLLLYCYNMTQA